MIYVTGDIHGAKGLERFRSGNFPEGRRMTKQDYVVILGDFGIPWLNDGSDRYGLTWLEQQPWTTLFVEGNHENYSALYSYPEMSWSGGRIHRINSSVYHLMRGYVFTIDGYRILAIGGAESIDKECRIPYRSWWPEENWSTADCRKIYDASQQDIDFVFAHTAPRRIVDELLPGMYRFNCDVSNAMEQMAVQFKKIWYFGHFHMDKKVNDKYTCLYRSVIKI